MQAQHLRNYFFNFIYLIIFHCTGSVLLCVGYFLVAACRLLIVVASHCGGFSLLQSMGFLNMGLKL